MVWFADLSIEKAPMMVSNWTVPEASGNFCQRGGRFGAHSSNESMDPVYYKKMAFIAFFNAGVRALDIRNPFQPKEVGYFIPAITEKTDKRCVKVDGQDRCKTAIQTNNVETDARGYIYIVDRANTGMHILELGGEARTVAGLNRRTPDEAPHDRPDIARRRHGGRHGGARARVKTNRPSLSQDVPWRPIAWPFPRDAWPARAAPGAAARSRSMCGPSSASAAIATPASSPTRRSQLPRSRATSAMPPASAGHAATELISPATRSR